MTPFRRPGTTIIGNVLPQDPDDKKRAWTQDVDETDMLLKVVWASCGDKCKFHMGDDQWEDIEAAANIAFENNNRSPDSDADMGE